MPGAPLGYTDTHTHTQTAVSYKNLNGTKAGLALVTLQAAENRDR